MAKKGEHMRARAGRLAGGDLEVGSVVQFGIHDVDRAKLEDPNLTCVIVARTVRFYRLAKNIPWLVALRGHDAFPGLATSPGCLAGLAQA